MSSSARLRFALLAAASGFAVTSTQAFAQSSAPQEAATSEVSVGEIVVTARKRSETLMTVPVAVSAVSAEVLNARGISTLEGFARLVPQLFLATSSGSFQGGALGLRGISAGDGNVFGDQAVAFNIDGVQIARATPRQLSQFDLQQIEVLKGPQALYYGKNSPGGIVVIRTADPTDSLEAGGKVSYEFNAREVRGEAFVSGPIADGLGARVALSASDMRGWARNIATPGTLYSAAAPFSPDTSEFNTRVTLKFDRGGPFSARFKFNYGRMSDAGVFSNTQRVYCPAAGGVPQLGGPDDCTPDNRVVHASIGTRFGSGGANTVSGAAISGVYVFGDGVPYSHTTQYLSGLEMKYDLSDQLQLASNTGYYHARIEALDNVNSADGTFPNSAASPAGAGGMVASYADARYRELSQELRLTSSFGGPVEFMLGGFFQDQKLQYVAAAAVNAVNPIQLFPPVRMFQTGTAYSVFGSVSVKPASTLEISGGLRYSHEKKDFAAERLLPGTFGTNPVTLAVPKRSFNNVSPEAVVTWRPDRNLTVYGGWRRGFLSGGFNGAGSAVAAASNPDNSYDEEVVEGFEGGVKAQALDGMLRVTLAGYSYKIKGLQVAANLPGPPVVQVVNNAANATTKGFEADFNLTTPVDGLSLHGAIAYTKARYTTFELSPCYGGQTVALGCNRNLITPPAPAGALPRFVNQDLSGQQLVRAPDWAGSIGAAYDLTTSDGGVFGLTLDGNYTGTFFTDALNSPGGVQKDYWLLDASTHYKMPNGIDLALIGRNLTNKYYFQRSSAAPLTGTPAGFAAGTQADQVAYVSRGREIRVQLSYKF